MTNPYRSHPLKPQQQTLIPPAGCRACKAPFNEHWRASRWTLSGYSPWCPQCHAIYAPPKKERGGKPGPKPKGWTSMPIC